LSDGQKKKKYIEMFGSFTEPFNYIPMHLWDNSNSEYIFMCR